MPQQIAIRASDMRLIEDLFEMASGYVLDFTNQTFAEFFHDELQIAIDHPRYSVEGGSKAKRLRYLLRTSDPATRTRVVAALWEYRETRRRRSGKAESVPGAAADVQQLLARLSGKLAQPTSAPTTSPGASNRQVSGEVLERLKTDLLSLTPLKPQERGYAFERFLKRLFDAHGLAGRASFRLIGEQIDGSFELSGATYLLEAKWTNLQVGATELRAFTVTGV
jgi:hypothetical protein